MIVFFLIGYICVSIWLVISAIDYNYLLVSFIFLFGSLLILCMVNAQKTVIKNTTKHISGLLRSMFDSIEVNYLYKNECSDKESDPKN